jgi:hypothetical protein
MLLLEHVVDAPHQLLTGERESAAHLRRSPTATLLRVGAKPAILVERRVIPTAIVITFAGEVVRNSESNLRKFSIGHNVSFQLADAGA